MRNINKKPLTHKQCVKGNHTVVKIIVSIVMMLLPLIPFVMESETMLGFILALLFCVIFAVLGVIMFFSTLKSRAKLATGQYFIYLDMVAGKRVIRDDDGNSYHLQFARNQYEKSVSKKKYDATGIGTQYYLVQLTNANQAFAAYPAQEYYLDNSVQHKFRSF